MKHEIEILPFQIPNFVRQKMPERPRHSGFKEAPAIPLCELSDETLNAMCDEFRRGVFARAQEQGKAKT